MQASAFLLFVAAAAAQSVPERVEFFEKKVRPVLVNRCYACHSAATKPAGCLRLPRRDGMLVAGDPGPVIVPSEPEVSLTPAEKLPD